MDPGNKDFRKHLGKMADEFADEFDTFELSGVDRQKVIDYSDLVLQNLTLGPSLILVNVLYAHIMAMQNRIANQMEQHASDEDEGKQAV